MKESINTAFLIKVMMFFLATIIALIIGTLNYTKTYRIKNHLVEIIEKHKGFTTAAKNEINTTLREIGYKTNPLNSSRCPSVTGGYLVSVNPDFRYCIYRHNDVKGYFYTVVVYMYFEVPVIADFFEFPVSGQTIVIYDL
jgi:hypothetical protein